MDKNLNSMKKPSYEDRDPHEPIHSKASKGSVYKSAESVLVEDEGSYTSGATFMPPPQSALGPMKRLAKDPNLASLGQKLMGMFLSLSAGNNCCGPSDFSSISPQARRNAQHKQ